MRLKKVLLLILLATALSNNLFALLSNVYAPFYLQFRKTGLSDSYFYNPQNNTETNTFLFEDDGTGVPKESVGIYCSLYNVASLRAITVEFSDNYTDNYMLRHTEADDQYNYDVSVSVKKGADYFSISPESGIDANPKDVMTESERTIIFSPKSVANIQEPLILDAVLTLTLTPAEAQFITGQYSGQIILTIESA